MSIFTAREENIKSIYKTNSEVVSPPRIKETPEVMRQSGLDDPPEARCILLVAESTGYLS